MPGVLGAVDRLLHAPQNGKVHRVLLGPSAGQVDDPLQFKPVLQIIGLETEIANELGQIAELHFRGRLMDAAQQVEIEVGQLLCDGLVRCEHEFLNHLMALGVFFHMSPADFAIGVEVNGHFRQNQVDRTAGHPAFPHGHREPMHVPNELKYLGRKFFPPRSRVAEVVINFLVAEAVRAFDDPAAPIGSDDDPFVGQLDQHAHREPPPVRLEAGEVVRDDLREHRNHAVGQINAVSPGKRLAVQFRSAADEMRDVGDVNPEQPMAILQSLQGDGIIEVAGLGGIDGDDRVPGKVRSIATVFARVESLGLPPGVFEHGLGKFPGQAELVNDHLGIHPRLSAGTEDFNDHSFAFIRVAGKADHFHDDLVTRAAILGSCIADQNGRIECAAVDQHQPQSGSFPVGADKAVGPAADNFNDLAGPPLLVSTAAFSGAGDHAVATGGIENFPRGDEEVLAAVAGHGAVGD